MPKTINPTNGEIIEEYSYISREKLDKKIELAQKAFKEWKNTSNSRKKELFLNLAKIIKEKENELALLDTQEMGMLLKNSKADISKTISGTIYFAEHFEEWLKDENFNKGGLEGKITYEPLGVLYSISPWNFPFNQVFRNAVPNILAGNTVLSKHASNVVGVARKIEELFLEAGFPKGVYQNLEASPSESEYIISNPIIKGTNITGGNLAGREIGKLAGKYLKPSILELGGNDPFILLDTQNIEETAKNALNGRLSCNGQKCNSSKRIIIIKEYYDEFCQKYKELFELQVIGDPLDSNTTIGPLAKESLMNEIDEIVNDSIKQGAKLITGGKKVNRVGYYYQPTILVDAKPGMRAFDEEIFGPVATVIKADSIDHAIELANNSKFGLASCVFTEDKEKFDYLASKIESGNCFWNKIPTSYPFLPYGGIKDSGYGKELGERGIKNFVNQKVIVY